LLIRRKKSQKKQKGHTRIVRKNAVGGGQPKLGNSTYFTASGLKLDRVIKEKSRTQENPEPGIHVLAL
jgi:hypothetical protein